MNIININIEDFPTLPTIYTQLIEVLNNSRSTVEDIAAIIEKDQSSSIKILKTVNSPIYGIKQKVDSIKQAIIYLGFQEVKNLVFSLSMINLFSSKRKLEYFSIVDFWKHSIAVGVITRKLGGIIGEKRLDSYFLSGIIHDIGKLYFLYFMQDEYAKTLENMISNNKIIFEAESEYLGSNHCDVGLQIAKKWDLPDNLSNSIYYHQSGFVDGKFDPLIACVHIADIMARAMHLGNPGDNQVPRPNPKIWSYLNIPSDTFSKLHTDIYNTYQESASILLVN